MVGGADKSVLARIGTSWFTGLICTLQGMKHNRGIHIVRSWHCVYSLFISRDFFPRRPAVVSRAFTCMLHSIIMCERRRECGIHHID